MAERGVVVRPVTPSRWADLEAFFGPSGAYSNCWCSFFRQPAKDYDAGCRDKGAANHELMRRLTAEGSVPGLLAYENNEPVGWVSVAPREQFVRVTSSRLTAPAEPTAPDEQRVWSVVCFWAPRAHRGKGIGDALLLAAVAHAYKKGAKIVEGYPVDTSAKWVGHAGIYHGTVGQFERAGFVEVRRPNDRRAVMRHRRIPDAG
jgi:GNAT superfamily N-acetyltransferase